MAIYQIKQVPLYHGVNWYLNTVQEHELHSTVAI